MDNIKTAGFWSNLVDGIKGFWKKYSDYFDDKEEYKKVLQSFKKQGYNVDPDKMKMFKKGNIKYIDNNGQIFMISNQSDETKAYEESFNEIKQLIKTLEEQYELDEEGKQIIIESFEQFWKKLEVIKLDSNLTLIATK